VAAICGATAGLARGGLLGERDHTSAAPEYLAATGHSDADRYVEDRAVVDDDLITAGPQSPVQFAHDLRRAFETLQRVTAVLEAAGLIAFARTSTSRGECPAVSHFGAPRCHLQ
jgi:hypothetical protein